MNPALDSEAYRRYCVCPLSDVWPCDAKGSPEPDCGMSEIGIWGLDFKV